MQMFGKEPVFDFLPRPRGFAQKGQAGFYARINPETADGNAAAQLDPAVARDHFCDDGFQRDAVEGIARMIGGRGHASDGAGEITRARRRVQWDRRARRA